VVREDIAEQQVDIQHGSLLRPPGGAAERAGCPPGNLGVLLGLLLLVELPPTTQPDRYLALLAELRGEAELADPVLTACRSPDERDGQVLDAAIEQLAREASALAFDRVQAERRGVDVSALCSRRVAALSALSSLIAARARLGREGELNVRDSRFQRVVSCFEEQIAATAEEVMGRELAEVFLARYHERVAGWEQRFDPPHASEDVSSPAR